MNLAATMRKLNQQYGHGTVVRGVAGSGITDERLPTGSLGLDIGLQGGWKASGINLLWGRDGTAKSYLTYRAVALAQQAGKTCALVDIERSLDSTWAQLCGVDVDKLIIAPASATAEEAYQTTVDLVSSGIALVVLDSLVGLSIFSEVDRDITRDGYAGAMARAISLLMRRLIQALMPRKEKNRMIPNPCCVLLTNQARARIGGIPQQISRPVMPGGHALRHLNHNEVVLRRIEDLRRNTVQWMRDRESGLVRKTTTETVGQRVQWEVRHAKFNPRGAIGAFSMIFRDSGDSRRGITDRTDEIIRYGLHYGVFTYDGRQTYGIGDSEFRGRQAFEEAVGKLGEQELGTIEDHIKVAAAEQERWTLPKTGKDSRKTRRKAGGRASHPRKRGPGRVRLPSRKLGRGAQGYKRGELPIDDGGDRVEGEQGV